MPEPTPVLPEVLSQIRALPTSSRPLIVCDVDEVILHLTTHLEDYLRSNDLMFLKYEYRLTGNIGSTKTGAALPSAEVRQLLMSFFDEISPHQNMVSGADLALRNLAINWDVVLLTNLPGAHNRPIRENLLAAKGIHFPVLTNSGPKGGAVAALSAGRPEPVIFIDDSPSNHASVHASLPSSVQIQFIADPRFLTTMAPESHVNLLTGDWQETETFINGILPSGKTR